MGRSSEVSDSRLCGRDVADSGSGSGSGPDSGWGSVVASSGTLIWSGSSGTSSACGAKGTLWRRMSVSLAMMPRRRRNGMTAADAHDLQGLAWPLEIPVRPLSFRRLDSVRFDSLRFTIGRKGATRDRGGEAWPWLAECARRVEKGHRAKRSLKRLEMVLDGSGLRCKVDARDESPRGFGSVQRKYRYASKAQHRRHSLSRDDIAWMAPAAVPTVERRPLQAQGVGLAFAQGGPQLRVDARVLRWKLAARRCNWPLQHQRRP